MIEARKGCLIRDDVTAMLPAAIPRRRPVGGGCLNAREARFGGLLREPQEPVDITSGFWHVSTLGATQRTPNDAR